MDSQEPIFVVCIFCLFLFFEEEGVVVNSALKKKKLKYDFHAVKHTS